MVGGSGIGGVCVDAMVQARALIIVRRKTARSKRRLLQ